MRTAVVILNWNTKEYLRAFLPALLHSCGSGAEVVVADSASTDGSMEMMAAEFPGVKTIPLDANYGFTGGYNRALAQLDAEFFVLINSDILVEDAWLEPLVAWMDSHPECGICGPKLHGLVKEGGEYRKTSTFEYAGAAGGYLDRFGFPFCRGRVLGRVCEDQGQYDDPADVLWVTGACLMIRSSLWKAMGGLDGRFFAHMEEIDLCWRSQLAGWKVTTVPQSVVWHLGGGTLSPKSPFKLQLNYRNNLLLLEKNLAPTYMAGGLSAAKAERKTRSRMRFRLLIDNLTRIVYFCTGKKDYAAAVKKAHTEWRQLSSMAAAPVPPAGICGKVAGFIPINIIPNALLRGSGIFKYLENRLS